MKAVDLTQLKNNDVAYEQIASTVSERYVCSWDDAVHDSYREYVKQVQNRAHDLRKIRCKAEELVQELEALRIDDLRKKTNYLCGEADTV